ncbi:MAG: hypothetical protein PVI57_18040 [Gemmatimonadota bacterium]|jgi:hypothetical protein
MADLADARTAWKSRAWERAAEAFERADAAETFGAPDLERLASAALLAGSDTLFEQRLERAFHEHDAAGNPAEASRSTRWSSSRP